MNKSTRTPEEKIYREYAPFSISMASVAYALVKNGWVIEDDCRADPAYDFSLIAKRASDEAVAMIYVDTEINGHPSEYAFDSDMQEMTAMLKEKASADVNLLGCYRFWVKLDHMEGNRYAIALKDDCGFPEKLELPAPGTARKPSEEDPAACNYKAGDIVKLFHWAFGADNWEGFIHTLYENMSFDSDVVHTHIDGKIDFIRHITRLIKDWKDKNLWEEFSAFSGLTATENGDSPCCMICFHEQPITCFMFETEHGRVSHIKELCMDDCADFRADEEGPPIPDAVRNGVELTPEQLLEHHHTMMHRLEACMREDSGEEEEDPYGFTWIKTQMTAPAFCHAAFEYRGHALAVMTTLMSDGYFSLSAEERNRLMDYAEEHDLIPCVFPQDETGAPVYNSWNLLNLKTMKFFSPTELPLRENAPMSLWEQRLVAIDAVCNYLDAQGDEVVFRHDLIGAHPQLWFRDKMGRECWVLLCYDDGTGPDTDLSAVLNVKDKLTVAPGYLASIKLKAPDGGVPKRHEDTVAEFDGLIEVTETMWP